MDEGILSAIGNTPMVRLSKVSRETNVNLYAKLEGLNPGGSMKDRAAFSIIRHGLQSGVIKKGTVIIESSSGNMGIGLAQACSCYGLRFVCVVDPKASAQNISLLRTYGTQIDLVTEPDPVTGEFLKARLDRVQHLLDITENSYWPDQYSNVYNSFGHHQTMEEIMVALGGKVDYLLCATSTCGTLRGCAEYARAHGLDTKTLAVDAVGSVIFGGERAERLIPGHGAAIRPALYQSDIAVECIHVTDLECVVGCRRLALQEAVLAGGSSGAVLMAFEKIKHRIPAGANCVLILADRGERYLDTIYSDEWVKAHFGDVSSLWEKYLCADAREMAAVADKA